MRYRKKLVLSLSLVASVVLLIAGLSIIKATGLSGKQDKQEDDAMPSGRWTVAIVPDSRQDRDSSVPILITRTTTSMQKGKDSAFEEVILWSRASKRAIEIKLRYSINEAREPNNFLYKGDPFVLPLKSRRGENPLKFNERRVIKIPGGKIARLIKPLVKDGAVNGDFIVTVSLSEVTFDDGTTWRE